MDVCGVPSAWPQAGQLVILDCASTTRLSPQNWLPSIARAVSCVGGFRLNRPCLPISMYCHKVAIGEAVRNFVV
jgi:hypothetical protein